MEIHIQVILNTFVTQELVLRIKVGISQEDIVVVDIVQEEDELVNILMVMDNIEVIKLGYIPKIGSL